jgi:hypothetical protein
MGVDLGHMCTTVSVIDHQSSSTGTNSVPLSREKKLLTRNSRFGRSVEGAEAERIPHQIEVERWTSRMKPPARLST